MTGTLAYLEDCAHQAGLATVMIDMEAIGRTPHGLFVDAKNVPIDLLFKLYPWEWMMREAFGRYLPGAPTQFVEPPWKAILSNKGILPLLWAMFPGHPNLLPAYFDDDEKPASSARPTRASRSTRAKAPISSWCVARQYRRPGFGPLRRRGLCAPGAGAAAAIRRPSRRARLLDRRRAALRPVGARGCEPDHEEFVALRAARHRRLGGLRKSLLQLHARALSKLAKRPRAIPAERPWPEIKRARRFRPS